MHAASRQCFYYNHTDGEIFESKIFSLVQQMMKIKLFLFYFCVCKHTLSQHIEHKHYIVELPVTLTAAAVHHCTSSALVGTVSLLWEKYIRWCEERVQELSQSDLLQKVTLI